MKITVKKSTMVKPMEETPSGSLWLSPLDLIFPANQHSSWLMFYRPNGAANFFDTAILKAALSRALVEFYPLAGRLRKDDNGRIEINCNGEGVLFVEAECDGTVDDLGDLGDLSSRPNISLVAAVDYSKGLSSFPLSLIQITRFKCGGICFGYGMQHQITDGTSIFHFLLRWCGIARGGAAAVAAAPPFLDRRILAPRNRPMLNKIEDQQPPSLETPVNHSETTSFRTFTLTPGQIKSLKQTCESKYTAFEVVAGHAWRCVTTARQLPANQETGLQISLDGRQKFQPPLPAGYSGNVLVYAAAVASCGELESNPLGFAVEKVHEAIARVDDEYMRTAVDYCDDILAQRSHGAADRLLDNKAKYPNLEINSWLRLPAHKMDFGWGGPIHVGHDAALPDGRIVLLPHLEKEGTVLLTIGLYEEHMEKFEKLLYMISVAPPIIMSKV